MGFIYILSNPSFPEYVKIGYADNVEQRLKQLNQSECVPFAFRVYATYEVQSRLSDQQIHKIIDTLNPNLRSIENYNGKQRVREFYAMSKEDAYNILYAVAEINGLTDKIKKIEMNEREKDDEITAEEIEDEYTERRAAFKFSMCNINPGEYVTWIDNDEMMFEVCDDKHVKYNGKPFTLSRLAAILLKRDTSRGVRGPMFFKYKGEILGDIRRKNGY